MKKHVIYNSNIESEDLKAAKEWLLECNNEIPSDNQVWAQANDKKALWLDDERVNLNIRTAGRILAIADLGLWHGRRSAYKIIDKRNVNGIFDAPWQDSFFELYVEGADVKARDVHHDGVNYYTFRELREETNYEVLLYREQAARENAEKEERMKAQLATLRAEVEQYAVANGFTFCETLDLRNKKVQAIVIYKEWSDKYAVSYRRYDGKNKMAKIQYCTAEWKERWDAHREKKTTDKMILKNVWVKAA